MFANASRISVVSQMTLMSNRRLSLVCNQSIEKFNGILEEYRASHYSQELPRRFRKDIVKAASQSSEPSSGLVSAEGIECILRNIGAGDQMSRSEIESMLREVNNDTSGDAQNRCAISADQLLNLIATKSV
ncbi:hypothetical protein HJC23_004051 [Cyclotella cryptica]|uniref:Uncharacterized protein n=1 Tax=Cyclotella cryptica TaxID=29204 RepID=A0ABD3QU44_9STRA|eukprot:CCRYP_002044-RB/>CCRYP_002044-RB protein AED:0.06 eAED:0.06 QI:670/1/1/1/0.5/0.33/3/3539/130